MSLNPKRLLYCVLSLLASSSCARHTRQRAATSAPDNAGAAGPPAIVLGSFADDYGGRFTITPSEFTQLPRGRFHIVQWNRNAQFFLAQNDSRNRSDPSRWTRIDYVPLSGMAPFTWAFCFSAWNAPTRSDALAAPAANRAVPRTGCNGFPFTRMQPQH